MNRTVEVERTGGLFDPLSGPVARWSPESAAPGQRRVRCQPMKRSHGLALALVIVSACGPSAKDAANSASGTPVSNVASNQTPTAQPTSAATSPPTATTAAPRRALTITASGYGVSSSGESLGYGYTVKNENSVESAESISVQVSFQDAAGVVLGTSSDNIAFIGPSDHIGMAGTAFFQNGSRTAKMTVQALPNWWTVSPTRPKLHLR